MSASTIDMAFEPLVHVGNEHISAKVFTPPFFDRPCGEWSSARQALRIAGSREDKYKRHALSSMTAKRKAEVTWQNGLLNGSGRVRFDSRAIPETDVTWASRTEMPNGKTSPEELLAAAHASCFAMAFSNELAKNKTPPGILEVTAVCTFDKVGDAWRVTTMELSVKGTVADIDSARFQELAQAAKNGCPISNAIKNNVEISLNATLA